MELSSSNLSIMVQYIKRIMILSFTSVAWSALSLSRSRSKLLQKYDQICVFVIKIFWAYQIISKTGCNVKKKNPDLVATFTALFFSCSNSALNFSAYSWWILGYQVGSIRHLRTINDPNWQRVTNRNGEKWGTVTTVTETSLTLKSLSAWGFRADWPQISSATIRKSLLGVCTDALTNLAISENNRDDFVCLEYLVANWQRPVQKWIRSIQFHLNRWMCICAASFCLLCNRYSVQP